MVRARRKRETIRLQLIVGATTRSLRDAAFPTDDESLDERGLREARARSFAPHPSALVVASPSRRARETAEALGLVALEAPELRDLAYGSWAGHTIAELCAAEPEAFSVWLRDPRAAPHGGESIAALVERIGAWLDARVTASHCVAVTHAAVARAAIVHALAAPLEVYHRIDVEPLSRLEFTHDGRRWMLRASTIPAC